MGVPRAVARLLLDEAKRRPFAGSVLTLGRLDIHFTLDELRGWAAEQGVALGSVDEIELSHNPSLADQGCLGDTTFLQLLGFRDIVRCDVSDWEGADELLDLNHPVPERLHGRFDVVLEAGTLQHIFHVPNVLANLHAFLAPGGRVIHAMAASNNHVDHGFYMFSPTLFHDWYTANSYRIEKEYVFEFRSFYFRRRFHSSLWRIYRYTPGSLDHLNFGGFGSHQVGIFTVATRTPEARADVMPEQSCFRQLWREQGAASTNAVPIRRPSLEDRLSPLLARIPGSFAAIRLWKRLRRYALRVLWRRMPPLIARY